jgi:hypothetical protein
MAAVVLDCDTGRRLGCAAFCCRLIVRYGPEDEPVYNAEGLRKSCVDKDPQTGLCVHLDTASQRCEIWERRPTVCRQFDCNGSELLQVVLAEGFVSLSQLVRSKRVVPPEQWQQVPYLPAEPD